MLTRSVILSSETTLRVVAAVMNQCRLSPRALARGLEGWGRDNGDLSAALPPRPLADARGDRHTARQCIRSHEDGEGSQAARPLRKLRPLRRHSLPWATPSAARRSRMGGSGWR